MANHKFPPILFLALFGVFLLVSNAKFNIMEIVKSPEGFIMMLLAAFTEANIYFLVRQIKTTNSWNHVFISYFFGAILLSVYFAKNIMKMKINGPLSMSLGINLVIGLFGYLLRFFAMSRLDTILYAALSYFGVIMAFVYGVVINGEMFNLKKIIGSLLIIGSNLYLLYE
jgi:drug/metabolite transporter (DMT)-like permease